MPDFQQRFEELEYELSHIEASFAEITNEPFPEFPGRASPRSNLELWHAQHERRTQRLQHLMDARATTLAELRKLLRQADR